MIILDKLLLFGYVKSVSAHDTSTIHDTLTPLPILLIPKRKELGVLAKSEKWKTLPELVENTPLSPISDWALSARLCGRRLPGDPRGHGPGNALNTECSNLLTYGRSSFIMYSPLIMGSEIDIFLLTSHTKFHFPFG